MKPRFTPLAILALLAVAALLTAAVVPSSFVFPTRQAVQTLTGSRALVSNSSGLLTNSAVTSTELGYVSGVTSAIQTQLDAKATAANLTTVSNTVTTQGNTLATNTALLNGTNTFTGTNNFTGTVLITNAASTISGNGAGLTNLNAGNIASGTISTSVLSTNVPLISASNQWPSIVEGNTVMAQYRVLYYTNWGGLKFYPATNTGSSSVSNAPSGYSWIVSNVTARAVSRSNVVIGFAFAFRRYNTSGTTPATYSSVWNSSTQLIYQPVLSVNGGTRGNFPNFMNAGIGSQLFQTRDGTNLVFSAPSGSAGGPFYPTNNYLGDFATNYVPGFNVSAPWQFSYTVGKTTTESEDAPLILEYLMVVESPIIPFP